MYEIRRYYIILPGTLLNTAYQFVYYFGTGRTFAIFGLAETRFCCRMVILIISGTNPVMIIIMDSNKIVTAHLAPEGW